MPGGATCHWGFIMDGTSLPGGLFLGLEIDDRWKGILLYWFLQYTVLLLLMAFNFYKYFVPSF